MLTQRYFTFLLEKHSFHQFLLLMVTVGNFLNSGSPRG